MEENQSDSSLSSGRDQTIIKKPLYKKWWFWVLIGLLVVIIVAGGYLYCRYFVWMKMSPKLQKKAETALAAGITVNDPKNDFLNQDLLGKEMDIPYSYNVSYNDIKSLSVGIDDKYLYYKATVWDKIPRKPTAVDGDYMMACGPQLSLNDDKGVMQANLAAEYGWLPIFRIFSLNSWYTTDPTGVVWPENERMKYQKWNSKVFGGAGYDYVMGAFPLDQLHFDIGKTAYLSFPMECKSDKHTHASVDHLGGTGKMEAVIIWKVGTKEFSVDNDFLAKTGSEGGGEDPKKVR